jgi:hypothetical protein
LVAGTRRLSLGNVTLAIKSFGPITDPKDISELSGTAAFKAWIDSGGKTPISADVQLDRGVLALPVPATAVVSSPSGDSCVHLTDGRTQYVEIITSSMGRSLVTWTGITTAPVSVRTSVEADATCD